MRRSRDSREAVIARRESAEANPDSFNGEIAGWPRRRSQRRAALSAYSFLRPPPSITKVAMAGALHDGFRARQRDVVTKSFRQGKIRATHEEEAELGLTQRPVKFRITTARDVDREG